MKKEKSDKPASPIKIKRIIICLFIALLLCVVPYYFIGVMVGQFPMPWSVAPPDWANKLQAQRDAGVLVGLIVDEIEPLSPASNMDLETGDIITAYNGTPVHDNWSYDKERDKYSDKSDAEITLTLWRVGKQRQVKAPAGRLGMNTNDFNDYFDQVHRLVKTNQSEKAMQLVDKLAQEKRLPERLLAAARIVAIPENPDPAQAQQLEQLIDKLLAFYPKDDYPFVAWNFLDKNNYGASININQRYLKEAPGDVSVILNIGVAYSKIGQYEQADQTVDQVLNQPQPSLSDYGFGVAYRVKKTAALGRKNYQQCLVYAKKMMEYKGDEIDWYTPYEYMFAAAMLKDLEQFNRVKSECQQTTAKMMIEWQHKIDPIEAYVLVANNQKDKAILLAKKWRNDNNALSSMEDQLKKIPHSAAVVDNWKELLKAS